MTDWEKIINEHGPEVFRLARRITGTDEDAEDVLQEVFLETHQFAKREPVREWQGLLRRKTTQRSLDRIRRRRPMIAIESLEIPSRTEGPLQAAIASELAEMLRLAIANLPEQQAAVFCLRYFDGLSNEDIGASLGMTSGAVATALHKARQKLAIALTPSQAGEPE